MTPNLIERGQTVQYLAIALSRGEIGLQSVPPLIKKIVQNDAWRERTIPPMNTHAAFESFQQFVEAPEPAGLHTTLPMLKRLCADDIEVISLIDKATQRPNGIHADNNVNSVRPVGNSRDQALRALRAHRPDLHAQVLAGELSPHAAAVTAGLRKPTHTIPHDVDAAARALRRHFTADELRALKEQL